MKKYIKVIIAILVSGIAVWLSFRHIDWGAFKSSFSRLRYGWIALAVGNSLLGVALLGARWRILLVPRASLRHRDLFRMNILAQYTNIVMPARMGEIVRVYLGGKEPNLSAAFVLGTLGAEKLLDLFVFAGLWISAPFFLRFRQVEPSLGIAFAFLLASTGLFFFLIFRPRIIRSFFHLVSPVFPRSLRLKASPWIEHGLEAFQILRSPKAVLIILAWTLLLILNQVLTNHLILLGTRTSLPIQASLFILLALQAGAIPPAAPGRIGVFEYAVIFRLSFYGVQSNSSLPVAVLLHLVVYLPKILLGGAYLMTSKLKLREAR